MNNFDLRVLLGLTTNELILFIYLIGVDFILLKFLIDYERIRRR